MSQRTYVSIDSNGKIIVNGPPSTMLLMHWRTLRMIVERARFARTHNIVYGAVTEDELTVLEELCRGIIESAQKAANTEANDDQESRREMIAAARRVDSAKRSEPAQSPAKRRSAKRAPMPDKPIETGDADGPIPHKQTLTNPSLVSHHREDEPR